MALLDTTILVDLMKDTKRRQQGAASRKLEELESRGEVLEVPIFAIAELHVGMEKATRKDGEARAVEECLARFATAQFTEFSARLFAEIVVTLQRRGEMIATMDALIASIAVENDALLVTRNLKHFARVPRIRLESY